MARLREASGRLGRPIAFAAAVTLVLAAGLVYAQGSSSDVVAACVNEKGKPRFVASRQRCRSGEERVTWNREGKRGPRGFRGPAGGTGPQGERGLTGTQGERGLTGAPGESVHVVVKTRTCEAIQEAIDKPPQDEGRIVLVAAGTYLCRAPIVIDRDAVTLRGTGPGTLLRLDDHVNRPVLVVGGVDPVPEKRRNIHVADLAIDGNRLNQDFECHTGGCTNLDFLRNNAISLRRVDDVLIEHVTANSARSGGLVADGSQRVTVRDFTASDNHLDGLAGYETTDSVFSGLFLHDNLAAGLSLDNDFDHNTVDDVAIEGSGDVGVFMRDVHRNVFSAMHVRDSGSHGIFLAQDDRPLATPNDSPRRNTFNSIMVFGSGGAGIWVNDTSCAGNLLVALQFGDNDDGDISDADAAGDCLVIPFPPVGD